MQKNEAGKKENIESKSLELKEISTIKEVEEFLEEDKPTQP